MQSFSLDWIGFMQSERKFCITELILHTEYPHKDASDLKFTLLPYQSVPKTK